MVALASPAAAYTPDGGAGAPSKDGVGTGHSRPLPRFVEKWQADKAAAADLVARGLAKADAAGIVTLRNGKKVQYRLQDTEQLTVVALDFSDVTHNNIPQPDRTVDNSTYWTSDFSTQHYRDMLFSSGGGAYGFPSLRDFYIQQSSGRFTWEGQVSNWVQSDQPAAAFGANSKTSGAGGDDLNGPVYRVVDAALKALALSNYGGLDLSLVDQTDRYDCDADGVFNEPDGYFDHFGVIHAGLGEEAGASPDTIWSHRWYANFNQESGPAGCQLGGYNLPGTNLWVGDYTTEPENGAVGVMAHEFGHDLGLPDLYDTSGGSENSTAFWTLMSSGSWASYAADSLDTAPVHMGSWEKLVLGWLDFAVATLGENKTFELGPAEHATRNRFQALRVNLDPYTKTTSVFPVDGTTDPNYYYSGQGNDIDNSMTRVLAAPLATATGVTFRANWNIETDWDYAYLLAQVDGVWQNVPTSRSTTTNPNSQNFGFGITGSSGGWTTVNATLPARTTGIGFRYWTDGAVIGTGFAVDTIQIVGGAVDNALASDVAAWTFAGFLQTTNGQFAQTYFHYYLVESRSYIDNDKSLCGAYNFLVGNWLEKQCYADGLLIWYRNSGYGDNNTALHPGAGQILPIDAHPATMIMPDNRTVWRTRWQMWDATFGVDSNSITLSQYRGARLLQKIYTAPAVTGFFDSSPTAYWNSAIPYNSVKTAGSGLRIDITGVSADSGSYQVHVYR